MLDDPRNMFCRQGFSIAILEIIVEFALPRQKQIVQPLGALQEKRFKAKEAQRLTDNDASSRNCSPFQIMIRPRPLLPFEMEYDEFPILRSGTLVRDVHRDAQQGPKKIVLHHGRIDRTGINTVS